jgi:hypothetical protein
MEHKAPFYWVLSMESKEKVLCFLEFVIYTIKKQGEKESEVDWKNNTCRTPH